MTNMKRIGIYGGTFDPPHKGHIAIAERAMKQLALDNIYFIPAYIPPHKLRRHLTTAKQRIAMMKLAIKVRKEFRVSAVELQRRGVSYTIDTLRKFRKMFPSAELVLIIGGDNLAQFSTWKSPKSILKLALLAVYRRKGFKIPLNINYFYLKGPVLDISSTEIRRIKNDGLSIRTLVPKSVNSYIKKHHLYSQASAIVQKRKRNEINCKH